MQRTRRCSRILEDRIMCGHRVAWSPAGGLIASGSWDYSVLLWDAHTGELRSALGGSSMNAHTDRVSSVAWSPTGAWLASGSHDETVRIWDVRGVPCGQPALNISSLSSYAGRVLDVAWSESGAYLAAACQHQEVQVWLFMSDDDGNTYIQPCLTLQGHTDVVTCVAWSPTYDHLVSGSSDNTLRVWGVQTLMGSQGQDAEQEKGQKEGRTEGQPKTPSSNMPSKISCRWSSAALVLRSGTRNGVAKVAWSPDGNHIVSGSDGMRLLVWSREGADRWSESAVAFDARSGKRNRNVSPYDEGPFAGDPGRVCSLAWSPSGKQLLVATSNLNASQLWNVSCGLGNTLDFTPVMRLSGHRSHVCDASFSPDGRQLVTASVDRTVRIWATATTWSDRDNRLFCKELREVVFFLMCIKNRLAEMEGRGLLRLPRLPMEMWLGIFAALEAIMK